jgi:hypothetical protein
MRVEFDLFGNALDSIETAIELVAWGDDQPQARRLKQAIQAVAHGVELLLKERLRRVHPSLTWENVDKYPNLNARTVGAEQALARLTGIGGLQFTQGEVEVVRSLRATRNAIEHYSWTTTQKEAEAIVGQALDFAFHFCKTELGHDFLGYASRKDDTIGALLAANPVLADALARRVFAPRSVDEIQPLQCLVCRAIAVDPTTKACRLCGHWNSELDDDIPF